MFKLGRYDRRQARTQGLHVQIHCLSSIGGSRVDSRSPAASSNDQPYPVAIVINEAIFMYSQSCVLSEARISDSHYRTGFVQRLLTNEIQELSSYSIFQALSAYAEKRDNKLIVMSPDHIERNWLA